MSFTATMTCFSPSTSRLKTDISHWYLLTQTLQIVEIDISNTFRLSWCICVSVYFCMFLCIFFALNFALIRHRALHPFWFSTKLFRALTCIQTLSFRTGFDQLPCKFQFADSTTDFYLLFLSLFLTFFEYVPLPNFFFYQPHVWMHPARIWVPGTLIRIFSHLFPSAFWTCAALRFLLWNIT